MNLFKKIFRKKVVKVKTDKIFFVHIPKTAGTSFRNGLEKEFGFKNSFFDYGLNSAETSDIIREVIYKEKDFLELKEYFKKQKNIFLSGHVPVAKYMNIFDTLSVVSFVREPVSQVISHFVHFKTKHNYEKTIEEFIEEKRSQNIQSRLLGAKPLELFGFIGLTEEYDTSIKIINHYFNTDIKVFKSNTNKQSNKFKESLSDKIIERIKEVNKKDIELYKKVKKLFEKHKKCLEENKAFIYKYIQKDTEDLTVGIAFQREGNQAVEIEIKDKENNNFLIKAKSFRPGMLQHNLPRDGFVGFEYKS